MQTQTNVVMAGSWKAVLTLLMISLVSSSRPRSCSWTWSGAPPPKSADACPMRPPNLSFRSISFPNAFSRIVGKLSRRSVWPVGAVSSTTRSYVPRLMSCMTLARATTSSVPAGSVSMISPRELSVEEISDPPSPPSSRSLPMRRSTESRNSESAAVGSISIAESVPSSPPGKAPGAGGTPYSGTSVREPPLRSMSRASPRLWAGSVLTRATECPADASAMAREADVVVLPTPPLPPHTTSLGFLGASGPASAVSSKDTRRSNPPPANVRPPR
mmetsp:Transcript_25752/g.57748  ORF Transcript_25752/g.57748 Transcript_25752/m.57748 type:complete len:273 (-) Transcript_25752:903-1721(-)